MSVLSRAFVPLVALGAGTWLGMGRPDSSAAWAAGAKAMASVAGAAHGLAPPAVAPPPLDRGPGPVDASAVPDPAPPWPRLNPEDDVERAWLLAQGPAHGVGDGRKTVTFTFDDGPFPETAPTILKILADHRIHATFFLIGSYLSGDSPRAVDTRAWARRIVDAGHLVGNHTMDHKELSTLSHAGALAEIDDASAAIERATGRRPLLFRPPYGELAPWLQGELRERHLDLQLWSIDVEDMKHDDPDDLVAALRTQLEYAAGGVVLLHDMHWPSVKAFNRLVRWMEPQRWDAAHPERPGWDIVDLPEYLRQTAASPQPYATRAEVDRARKAAAERRHAPGALTAPPPPRPRS